MAATKQDISGWFDRGKKEEKGATHMIVVCDTFDHCDYPVFVRSKMEALKKVEKPGEMQRVMEVYHLGSDKEHQLNQHRAFNYDPIPGKPYRSTTTKKPLPNPKEASASVKLTKAQAKLLVRVVCNTRPTLLESRGDKATATQLRNRRMVAINKKKLWPGAKGKTRYYVSPTDEGVKRILG